MLRPFFTSSFSFGLKTSVIKMMRVNSMYCLKCSNEKKRIVANFKRKKDRQKETPRHADTNETTASSETHQRRKKVSGKRLRVFTRKLELKFDGMYCTSSTPRIRVSQFLSLILTMSLSILCKLYTMRLNEIK